MRWLGTKLMHIFIETTTSDEYYPGANFKLTHPFLDLVSRRSANWQTAHARVGGVQPLNLEVN